MRGQPHRPANSPLFWQVRYESEWVYRAELEALARRIPDLSLVWFASRPAHGTGQRIDVTALRKALPEPTLCHHYLCAGNPLLNALLAMLSTLGVPEHAVHYERFSASVTDAGSWDCTLDGQPFRFDGHPSLLMAVEEAGMAIDADCRSGNCGRCLVRVNTGQTRVSGEPEFAEPPGHQLLCCRIPIGPLSLTRIGGS